VSSTGEIKVTGENRNTRRKTCPSASVPTVNLTRTGLVSKTEHRYDRHGVWCPEKWQGLEIRV